MVSYTYDAWGKPISRAGTLASTLGTVQPFRYRGYVFDEETGLYYLRSRYYNPTWCRFVNADTLYEGNLYLYCFNNSTVFVDEDGELGRNFMHDAVCQDIVDKSGGTLHKKYVKINGIPGKQYGLADIRSDDGMVWEVKRITCSPDSALKQLMGYLGGLWKIDGYARTGTHPRQGDNRIIAGIVTSVPGYVGYYANVGNGIILYDYEKLPTLQSDPSPVMDPLQKRVHARKRAYTDRTNQAIAWIIAGSFAASVVISTSAGGNSLDRIVQDFLKD